ncbi:acetate kinase [Candidatus Saccharibacteria bacterium]|nr:acetate kinase [Candidatus Saccharibacteria bacterium]MCL1963035.1 acetate kinase [Candidatus Saccharibacteria bacterium]
MKQVLVLNSGSSSLKYQLIDIDTEKVLASGNIECIGEGTAKAKHVVDGVKHDDMAKVVDNHAEALEEILTFFDKFGPKLDAANLIAVGHRVVHGGVKFCSAALIDAEVERAIDELSALAPLHNPPALTGIKVAKETFADVPHVAVFDTAYHQTLPEANYTYAIDDAVANKHAIRRYGFHGTSYDYVMGEVSKILKKPLEKLNTIVMHLGSGSSITAIKNGKSFDTSMGMTPLAGLVMGTRAGDIDPAVIFHLNREAGMSLDEIDKFLNKKSGFFGINDGVIDMREIMDAYDRGDAVAKRAMEVYVRRIHHYIGAYFVELGRVDAIVLTAGIGENNGRARRLIMSGLEESLGVKIDDAKNMENNGFVIGWRDISAPDSKIPVLVVQTNEELSIARQAAEIVK